MQGLEYGDGDNKKKSGRRLWKYAGAFAVPIICMLIHMAANGCYPFGDNTILLGDGDIQYYSFFTELADRVRNGQSIFFSWEKGLGYDFYVNFFYYLASPFNVIAVILGSDYMQIGMAVTLLVQIGCCGVAMTYFFAHTGRNVMKRGLMNDVLCMLCGLTYAMCDYMLAYQYNIQWLICLILIPLVMLGVEKLVGDGDVRLYFVTLLLSFVFNFYFSWFVCMLSLVWFVDIKKDGARMFFSRGLRYVLTSVVATACAGVVLVPCYILALSRSDDGYGSDMRGEIGNVADFIQSFFWGSNVDVMGDVKYGRNQYVGIFAVILLFLYVLNRRIDRRNRVVRILEILLLMVCCNVADAEYVLSGFTWSHSYSCRFAIILAVLIIVSAFEELVNYEKMNTAMVAPAQTDIARKKHRADRRDEKMGYGRFAIAGIVCVAAVVSVFVWNQDTQQLACYMTTILLSAYLLMITFFGCRGSISDKYVIINFIVVGFAEIISNSLYGSIYNNENDYTSNINICATSEWSDVYDGTNSDNLDRKTSWFSGTFDMCYSETNFFSSLMNTDVTDMYEKNGLASTFTMYNYRGTTPVTAVMLNVRNVLTDNIADYGGYHETASADIQNNVYGTVTYGVYEADYTAGLGFAAPTDILGWNMDNVSTFENQNDFAAAVSGVNDIFTRVATSEFTSYETSYSNCINDNNIIYSTLQGSSDNAAKYTNVVLSDGSYPAVQYDIEISRDMDLYAYVEDANGIIVTAVGIDGEILSDMHAQGPTAYDTQTLHIGEVKKGQKVQILVINSSTQLETGITFIDFYEYHDDKMQEFADYLRDKTMTVETVEDTYVKGTVTAPEDGILYTSIPYYKGWKAYVDGEETEIVQLANGALIGLEVTKGKHTIEFRYCTYGFKQGVIISCVGMVIAVAYMLMWRRKRKLFSEEI